MLEVATEHIPVMLQESIDLLRVSPGGVYVDCTAGLGGHSERILSLLGEQGHLIALDRDKEALGQAEERLSAGFSNVTFCHDNFRNLPLILSNLSIERIDGCLIDLGVSRLQLMQPERGFSFRHEGPLDMRMDRSQPITASQVVNQLSESELYELFRKYGEEPNSRRFAAAIVEVRREKRFKTTGQLADLLAELAPKRSRAKIHPATRVFQALRIEVNQELRGLDRFLSQVINSLHVGGRLAVISFHSLEDRIIKTTFRLESGACVCFRPGELCSCPRIPKVSVLTKKPLIPGQEEIEQNPGARSAKLRAVEKLPNSAASNDQE